MPARAAAIPSRRGYPYRIQMPSPPLRESENPFADPQFGEDGWRTPTIEDAHHPRNLELHLQLSRCSEKSESTRSQQPVVPVNPDGLSYRRPDSANTVSTALQSSIHYPRGPCGSDAREPQIEVDDEPPPNEMNLSIKQRLKHVSWAWFTLVMATGGIASVLHAGMPLLVLASYLDDLLEQQYPSASQVSGRAALSSSLRTSSSTSASGP
jgi:hypothetical protein